MHVPVMRSEVVELLAPGRGGVFVDCTVGLGGHARAIVEAGATRLVGVDRDTEALVGARAALSQWAGAVELVHGDYRALPALLDARGLAEVDGIVADLGVSSLQLDTDGRGFSFQRDEPLDMRFDRSAGETAAEYLAEVDESELADVIYRFGEERRSRRVARAIVAARAVGPIRSTGELAAIVRRVVPRDRRSRIDAATRTFQALRIRVNGELDGLDAFLRAAVGRLRVGGRIVVIAFHSLEDRVVKHTLRGLAREEMVVADLTKKPRRPTDDEVAANPRARSAKLRAAERVAVPGVAGGRGGR